MSRLPAEWVTKKPVERYETQFLYVGFSRYDMAKKTLSNIVRTNDGKTLYTERLCDDSVFAKCYITEYATVTVYSLNPRVWVEDLGVNDVHAFVQKQPTQVS
jgi:hypothetical protein